MCFLPTKITYHLVVEGKSEVQYFMKLNQLEEIKLSKFYFHPVPAGTFQHRTVKSTYYKVLNETRQRKPNIGWQDEKMILLDMDVFRRKSEKLQDFQDIQNPLYFSIFNFEDFLVQHLNSRIVQKWNNICIRNCHFTTPLTQDKYMIQIKKIFPNYQKGMLPFDLTIAHLQQLKVNAKNKILNYGSYTKNFLDWFIALLTQNNIV